MHAVTGPPTGQASVLTTTLSALSTDSGIYEWLITVAKIPGYNVICDRR